MKEKRATCIICSVENYILEKSKFFEQHPNAKILEEIKTLSMGLVEVPDPTFIGKTKQVQQLLVYYMVVYEEKIISTIHPFSHA